MALALCPDCGSDDIDLMETLPDSRKPDRIARVKVLRDQFLVRRPEVDSQVTAYWRRYQGVFTADGLQDAAPQDLCSCPDPKPPR